MVVRNTPPIRWVWMILGLIRDEYVLGQYGFGG